MTENDLHVYEREIVGPDSVKNPFIVECLKPGCEWKVSSQAPELVAWNKGEIHQESDYCPMKVLHIKDKKDKS